ncbi:MAG: hypothetical protein KBD65_02950 [Candidatus Moranbacteria bacterium]|nr:hypothetical protein [Candidatus Moranbacteria bacterium]
MGRKPLSDFDRINNHRESSKKYEKKKRDSYGDGGRTMTSWRAMKQRCFCKTHWKFKSYGGVGISVCDRWLKFENFLEDMGVRPKEKTLDRIDGNDGYYKENCRWATNKEQHANRSIKKKLPGGHKKPYERIIHVPYQAGREAKQV